MPLAGYRKKRDFGSTPEPAGRVGTRRSAAASFTVQKHDASRLHYDLRLEMEGVLRSWAVPKGPSLRPSDRRLAVEVEDHPLDYGTFEGTIPKGQYGGGTVLLWDRGTWAPVAGDPVAAYRAGSIKFTLHGDKLRGGWKLIRMHDSEPGLKSNWLLIKTKDKFAAARGDRAVTEEAALSVSSGRSIEEIASGTSGGSKPTAPAANGAISRSRRMAKGAGSRSANPVQPEPPGARKAPMLRQVQPQLCTLADQVPEGATWRHEVKFDGYRLMAFIESGRVRLVTRSGLDWTHRFPEVAESLALIEADSAVIDGEVVCLNQHGVSDFQELQSALKQRNTAPLIYFAFDLLYIRGHDIRHSSLDARRKALFALLQHTPTAGSRPRVRVSESIDGDGGVVLKNACRLRLEGVVSKQSESPYDGGRASSWIKVKCGERQEFVVGGYSEPKGSRSGFGALLVGHYDKSKGLVYAGKVGTGFDERAQGDLLVRLHKLRRNESPFSVTLERSESRDAHWVEPRLVAEVSFTQWTRDGRLRHPVYHGLRMDKEASDVVRERSKPLPSAENARAKKKQDSFRPTGRGGTDERPNHEAETGNVVLGVTITNPGRIVYPKTSITKLDVARYYAAVAEWMMPHVGNRPLSLVRCPRGAGGTCFFNKHLATKGLTGLGEVSIRESKGVRQYVVVREPAGLVSLVQMSTLEVHPWGTSADDIERPDRLVMDLDPGERVLWPTIVKAAERVREMLEGANLPSFVKTTGGKGLHVVAPWKPGSGWKEMKEFALAVARVMEEQWPREYTSAVSKAKRRGKVYIDYLRNQRGGTSVAAYSTRAREGGTVSMPVAWADLTALTPARFTIKSVPELLRQRAADPWVGIDGISKPARRASARR